MIQWEEGGDPAKRPSNYNSLINMLQYQRAKGSRRRAMVVGFEVTKWKHISYDHRICTLEMSRCKCCNWEKSAFVLENYHHNIQERDPCHGGLKDGTMGGNVGTSSGQKGQQIRSGLSRNGRCILVKFGDIIWHMLHDVNSARAPFLGSSKKGRNAVVTAGLPPWVMLGVSHWPLHSRRFISCDMPAKL